MNRPTYVLVAALAAGFPGVTHAHHSFAIYDIDNKISRTGVLTLFEFAQPHIQLVLDATLEDGSKETWEIESMSPGRWEGGTFVAETTHIDWPYFDPYGTPQSDRMSYVETFRVASAPLRSRRQLNARC